MSYRMERQAYAETFGPTTGDRAGFAKTSETSPLQVVAIDDSLYT